MLIYDKRMRSEADYLVALSQLCSFLFWYTAIHPPDDFVFYILMFFSIMKDVNIVRILTFS
jgi:hypothetical protein